MLARNLIVLVGVIQLSTAPAGAAILRRAARGSRPAASGVSQRKRLHINDLIAEPGTVEVDWALLYSCTTSLLSMPSAIKFTPEGNSLLAGRTEYSIAFDSIDSAVNAGGRTTQFSDRLTLAATSVVFDSKHFDLAVAPQVTTLLRNDSGMRAGATLIGRVDAGGNSFGISGAWSGATSTSSTNPAGIWDLGIGYGRHLAATGFAARITPHVNATLEKATGFERTLSVFAGIEYQCTAKTALDLTAQRYNLAGGIPDRQLLLGITVNLGKIR